MVFMRHQITTVAGKFVRKASKLRGGGGSALPGLVIERIDPSYMARCLSQLSYGVVVISGTNGKTTTTKMVVELLQSQGLRVFTNRTGSNFTRGIVAALIESVDTFGKLPFDIAVLELDEAYAVKFSTQIAPTYALFLNILRDQLDRFGEIDTTADMLRAVAAKTTKCVVINGDDPRLANDRFKKEVRATIKTYGVSKELLALFPSDDMMRDTGQAPTQGTHHDTTLLSAHNNSATIAYDGQKHSATLKLKGIYNILNATAAVALVREIMGAKLQTPALFEALSSVTPAFGRGEDIIVQGQPVELVLVKNPSGFRLSLASFPAEGTATMIAINDNYADGRDMSWLWDVDFSSLAHGGVAQVAGVRAYDMALRLQYEEVPVAAVEPNIVTALTQFLAAHAALPKRIYCTYTAMLTIRKQLAKIAKVEKVL